MIICIDGNDGSGKTTVVNLLIERFPNFIFQDRGLPSALTVNKTSGESDLYIILDCSIEQSLERLKRAEKNMQEYWHLPHVLSFYRRSFLDLSQKHGWHVVNADQEIEVVVEEISTIIKNNNLYNTSNDSSASSS